MTQGVTIGQAAAFAGVTVKTVRHYHRLGLVGEPRRDSSGYRRYGSAELLGLVQVRTLAGAGVPLAEIPALLDADPREFTTSLADVEQRLTERIDELRARRTMLRRLAGGDRALLPERAQAVLDRLGALGFEPVYVEAQQEAMVLIRALVPDVFDDFLDHTEGRLDDPEHVALLKRSWVAASWSPDDPRLEHLADDLARNLLDRHLPQALQDARPVRSEASARLGMINHHREAEFPAITRLNELVEARLRAAGVALPQ
jgi:DNA-binding transcriptional MerR regulator